jgi:hypothetical protein
MSNGALEKAKNAVVIVVQGAGDVVNASRTAVTDIMLSTLKDAREITGTALGVVTDAIRGAFRATGGRRRGGAGCPGRRIQGRGGRGPGRRDVTKVARGAAEQVLDTVVEVSPDAVGAVKRGSCRRPPSPGTSYAPSSRARRKEVVAVRPASVGEVLRPGSFRRRSSVPPNRPSSGAPCQVP